MAKPEIPLALDGGMNGVRGVIIINCWKSKNRHKYLLQYHLIFVCKYRKKILVGTISDDIKQLSYEICNKHNVTIKKWKQIKTIYII